MADNKETYHESIGGDLQRLNEFLRTANSDLLRRQQYPSRSNSSIIEYIPGVLDISTGRVGDDKHLYPRSEILGVQLGRYLKSARLMVYPRGEHPEWVYRDKHSEDDDFSEYKYITGFNPDVFIPVDICRKCSSIREESTYELEQSKGHNHSVLASCGNCEAPADEYPDFPPGKNVRLQIFEHVTTSGWGPVNYNEAVLRFLNVPEEQYPRVREAGLEKISLFVSEASSRPGEIAVETDIDNILSISDRQISSRPPSRSRSPWDANASVEARESLLRQYDRLKNLNIVIPQAIPVDLLGRGAHRVSNISLGVLVQGKIYPDTFMFGKFMPTYDHNRFGSPPHYIYELWRVAPITNAGILRKAALFTVGMKSYLETGMELTSSPKLYPSNREAILRVIQGFCLPGLYEFFANSQFAYKREETTQTNFDYELAVVLYEAAQRKLLDY